MNRNQIKLSDDLSKLWLAKTLPSVISSKRDKHSSLIRDEVLRDQKCHFEN